VQPSNIKEERLLLNQLNKKGRLILTSEQTKKRLKLEGNLKEIKNRLKKLANQKCSKCKGEGFLGIDEVTRAVLICKCAQFEKKK